MSSLAEIEERSSVNHERPIFIVGMQRSGTTLLRSILSAHPRIAIAPETHFLNRFLGEQGKVVDFEDLWRTFQNSDRFQDLAVPATEVEDEFQTEEPRTPRNLFRAVLRAYARRQQKEVWGEKTPHHHQHIGELLEWFPGARIVAVVRDPRGICSSLMDIPWRRWDKSRLSRLEPRWLKRLRRICTDGTAWQSYIDELRSRWAQEPRVKVITYEALVREPENTVREVCDFLEEQFVEAMLTDRKLSLIAVPERSERPLDAWTEQHLAATVAPIDEAPLTRWLKRLEPSEVYCLEGVCRRGMLSLGYSPVSTRIDLMDSLRAVFGRLWYVGYESLLGKRHR